jgi:nucleoid DNA-binding protein
VTKGEVVEAIANASKLSDGCGERVERVHRIRAVRRRGRRQGHASGFGTFAPSARKARTGMNPQTREPIRSPHPSR